MSILQASARVLGDNRTLGHKTPCRDCPFRKDALKGYLGGYELEKYSLPPRAGVPTSCHEKDYGAGDCRTRLCAGSCATIAADETVPKYPEYEDAIQAVAPRADCFDSVEEFETYHEEWNRRMVIGE